MNHPSLDIYYKVVYSTSLGLQSAVFNKDSFCPYLAELYGLNYRTQR